MNRNIISALFIVCALVMTNLTACKPDISENKPNIVFIFADDQCYDAIAALGINKEVITPNLDRLANRGMVFTHAYNMGAWQPAVCIASRTMLNTGRYVWDAHKYDDKEAIAEIHERGELWGQMMSRAGYETYMTGKWHLKIPASKVFDNVVHERPGMPDDAWSMDLMKEMSELYEKGEDVDALMANGYARPKTEKDSSWLPWDKSKGGYWEGGKHWSEVLGDDARMFIDQAAERANPFFMYLAFNAPHDPRQSPKEFVDSYPLEDIGLPESFMPEYPYKDEIGCSPVLRDEGLAPYPRTAYSVKVNRQEYYAIITHMDQQIGRILDALEASGISENTYIFFTADHGLAVGNHGFMGKQNMYDHSIRPPLIVAGPGVPKGSKTDAAVYLQDIMASSLDMAGIDKPDYVRFNSLMPLAFGETNRSVYPAIYGCYVNDQRMIRREDYKLIMYPNAGVFRLYDMKNDPLELQDLAGEDRYENLIAELSAQFRSMQAQYGDTLKLDQLFD